VSALGPHQTIKIAVHFRRVSEAPALLTSLVAEETEKQKSRQEVNWHSLNSVANTFSKFWTERVLRTGLDVAPGPRIVSETRLFEDYVYIYRHAFGSLWPYPLVRPTPWSSPMMQWETVQEPAVMFAFKYTCTCMFTFTLRLRLRLHYGCNLRKFIKAHMLCLYYKTGFVLISRTLSIWLNILLVCLILAPVSIT